MKVDVHKNDRGAWCVYIDGVMVSDHASHEAARLSARNHYIAAVRAEETTDE